MASVNSLLNTRAPRRDRSSDVTVRPTAARSGICALANNLPKSLPNRPIVPNDALSGLDLSHAVNSPTSLAGRDALPSTQSESTKVRHVWQFAAFSRLCSLLVPRRPLGRAPRATSVMSMKPLMARAFEYRASSLAFRPAFDSQLPAKKLLPEGGIFRFGGQLFELPGVFQKLQTHLHGWNSTVC
jgi:hypothetical protein